MKTTKKIEVFCDICGKMIIDRLYGKIRCEFCARIICPICQRVAPEDISSDDTTYICKKCFEIAKPFYSHIKLLNSQLEKLHSDIEMACIKQRELNK